MDDSSVKRGARERRTLFSRVCCLNATDDLMECWFPVIRLPYGITPKMNIV